MRLFPHNNSVDEVHERQLSNPNPNPNPNPYPSPIPIPIPIPIPSRSPNPIPSPTPNQVNERQLDALPSRPMRYEAAQHDPTGRLAHRVAGPIT